MEPSPLTQQDRPSVFQPKIDSLYEQLLSSVKLPLRPNKISFLIEMQDEEDQIPLSDGFWQEFFLLRADKSSLQHIVLAKRYTNPSSEIITVLAGLDEVDDVFLDFANAVEVVIRTGRSGMFEEHVTSKAAGCIDSFAGPIRRKAVEVAIALTAGAYQTSLYIHDLDTPVHIFEPFLLLGLLANYNKFEFRNPYRSRLEDFVDGATIQQIIRGFGALCSQSRDKYVAIQEDIQEGWTLSSTLKYIGLGVLAPSRSSTPTPNPPSRTEDTKDPFGLL
ncbi:MAG: hypothetical protein Q9206_005573 [Seirophora lacunosa]